ncbi:MAG: hypothetical protein Q9210_005270 [Variospora velana]
MPFEVHPCNLEDLPLCTAIQWQALASNPFWQVHFPNGGTQDLQNCMTYHTEYEFNNLDLYVFKAVNTSRPNDILGYAKWTIEEGNLISGADAGKTTTGEQTATQHETATDSPSFCPPPVADEDSNDSLFKAWLPEVMDIRRTYLTGTRTIMLDDLCVLPDHQRQGLGTLLLKKFLDFADNRSFLPCYLESTPVAFHMYLHQSFRKVDEVEIDLANWTKGYGMYKTVMMYRDASGALDRQGDETM